MQIHELNNFTGNLDGSAYMAVDNGTDTGKVSVAGLLLDVNESIDEAEDFLNARIDNIIAGGTAPSAEEVTDARLGADGTVYASLGDAIRGQVSDITNDLDRVIPIAPVNTTFFNNLNYGAPDNVEFRNDIYINNNGEIIYSADLSCIVFSVEPNTTYNLYVPGRNRSLAAETSSDFVVGRTYTTLTISQSRIYNGEYIAQFTTGASAKKVIFNIYKGTYDYESNKNNIIIDKNDWYPEIKPTIDSEYLPPRIFHIRPKDTTFFAAANHFDPEFAQFYSDRYIDTDGEIIATSKVNTLVFPVEPNTTYYLDIPNANRSITAESADANFAVREVKTVLINESLSYPISFTTSSSAQYVGVYFYSGTYDYEGNKNNIYLNKDAYYGNVTPFIPSEYLPLNQINVLNDANILIFGDSITDCCSVTVNGSKETTAYTWLNPSNSYVDGGGQTINFSMWPKILKESMRCGEIRNYAFTGASYKTAVRPPGNERQNLHYQIDVAFNDLDNPNNVFSVANYVPDIVIFALGTNDGAPNDTYDSAMAKTVYQGDGVSIDTAATMAALDTSKFCESARSAFMRIKNAFPMAQIFVVLPIQRANDDTNLGTLHEYLKQMAQRYGCIIVDGAFETSITRDFNKWNALGTYLKDGLHPNEKGQNLLARAIIASLTSHYIPFGNGFNS